MTCLCIQSRGSLIDFGKRFRPRSSQVEDDDAMYVRQAVHIWDIDGHHSDVAKSLLCKKVRLDGSRITDQGGSAGLEVGRYSEDGESTLIGMYVC